MLTYTILGRILISNKTKQSIELVRLASQIHRFVVWQEVPQQNYGDNYQIPERFGNSKRRIRIVQ